MSQIKRKKLTLHGLMGAVSYWGTFVRTLTLALLMGSVLLANIIYDQAPAFVDSEIMTFVYVLGSLFVFDFCYVLIAKSKPLHHDRADATMIIIFDVILAALYIIPNLLVTSAAFGAIRYGAIGFVLLALAIRVLVGLLWPLDRKK